MSSSESGKHLDSAHGEQGIAYSPNTAKVSRVSGGDTEVRRGKNIEDRRYGARGPKEENVHVDKKIFMNFGV